MTICIATDNELTVESGITTFNRHLIQQLRNAGHSVVLLCLNEDTSGNSSDSYIRENKFVQVVLKDSYLQLKNKYKNYYSPGSFDAPRWIAAGLAYQHWLQVHAKNYGIDIVEVTDYGGLGIFLCKEGLPPLVITGHCCLIQYCRYNHCIRDAHYKTIERLERLSFRYANATIVHSRLNSDDVQTFSKPHVWQAPIPWTTPLFTSYEATENDIVVVGGLQILKGADLVCKALERLRKQGCKLTLHWIGGDTLTSAEKGSVASYLSKTYPLLWNRYFFWQQEKQHSETVNALQKALFVVIPSLWETFNYVSLEAASLGKAIILSDNTGAAELFTNNENAIIFPTGNEIALASAIEDLIRSPEKRRTLGDNAKDMIHHTFTNSSINKRLSIYEHVIQHFKEHDPEAAAALGFLKKQHTAFRSLYFRLRSMLKKILQ